MAFAVWTALKAEGTLAIPDIAIMRKADVLSLPWFISLVPPLTAVFAALGDSVSRLALPDITIMRRATVPVLVRPPKPMSACIPSLGPSAATDSANPQEWFGDAVNP